MKLLEKRIAEEGIVVNNDILKVDSFLNHKIDVALTCCYRCRVSMCFLSGTAELCLQFPTFVL